MQVKVKMPKWGEMTEGTVGEWLKKEGDLVKEGEGLVMIETEKINTEMESPASGKLLKIFVKEFETVKIGTLLAVIEEQ